MKNIIIINFVGGIISPGVLLSILLAANKVNVRYVRFGLRQQLFLDVSPEYVSTYTKELDKLGIPYQVDTNHYPNIISSYPAEEIFIRNNWVTEGVYKDILDTITFRPSIKVNICDNNQSFTPMLTGNINWIASAKHEHYWHLIIRFPKTNVIWEWDQLTYTNSIAHITKDVQEAIISNPNAFIDNESANGASLFALLDTTNFILKKAEQPVQLAPFNLPYYEGLNRYNNKYWLGIYRRDERFNVDFLKEICILCLKDKLGQLCCTSWKSIIIKGIEEKDKWKWNKLLEEFEITMRHSANELNFQVEDNCQEGLNLKTYLVKHFSLNDTRTFGICFGIKTRRKSEIFSSILIRKRYLMRAFGIKALPVYDILCAKDFNPNERTGEIFSKGVSKILLPQKLRQAVIKFYRYRQENHKKPTTEPNIKKATDSIVSTNETLYQCKDCLTVYDEILGDPAVGVSAGTKFQDLQNTYCCPLCDSPKNNFKQIQVKELQLL
jgi:rubredoxin